MNLIQIKYQELLRLSIEQLFYSNGICKRYQAEPVLDIMVAPTESNSNIMQRLNILFKPIERNAGFVLLALISGQNSAGDDLLRFPPRKDDALTFLMTLKNPELINFNDLPTQPPTGAMFYFNNDITDPAAPRTRLHISKNASGVNGTTDIIKKSSANYHFDHSSVVLPDTAVVKHILSGQEVKPKSLFSSGSQTHLVFNLNSLPIGRCELLINNVVADQFFYLGNHSAEPVFGVIEILLSSALPSNYRIIEADRSLIPQRPDYVIRFINRPTLWRYTIQVQPNSPLYLEISGITSPADRIDFINQLNIESNDDNITFTQVSATETEFIFTSSNPIPLREDYFSSTSISPTGVHDRLILTLKKYTSDPGLETAIKSNLPYPSTGTIAVSPGSQIFSDIFLTL